MSDQINITSGRQGGKRGVQVTRDRTPARSARDIVRREEPTGEIMFTPEGRRGRSFQAEGTGREVGTGQLADTKEGGSGGARTRTTQFFPSPEQDSEKVKEGIRMRNLISDIENREYSVGVRRQARQITGQEASRRLDALDRERIAILTGKKNPEGTASVAVAQGRLDLERVRLSQQKVQNERQAKLRGRALDQADKKLVAESRAPREKGKKKGLTDSSLNSYAKNIRSSFFNKKGVARGDNANFKAWRRYMNVAKNMSTSDRSKLYQAMLSQMEAPPEVLRRATPDFFPPADTEESSPGSRKQTPRGLENPELEQQVGRSVGFASDKGEQGTFKRITAKSLMLEAKSRFEQEKGRPITEADMPEIRKRALALQAAGTKETEDISRKGTLGN